MGYMGSCSHTSILSTVSQSRARSLFQELSDFRTALENANLNNIQMGDIESSVS